MNKIQELIRVKAEVEAKLRLMPYTGTPEIKESGANKYLYMRKRELGKLKSVYVDKFSQQLYDTLLRYSKQSRELTKQLRAVEKELAELGFIEQELSPGVQLNLDFARINMKANIYDQAVLEGVATTFPQTETIIDNGVVNGMTATDIQKILNLKHAWEFILDKDVILTKSDFYVLSNVAQLVNEGFYYNGGRIRVVPVAIGGSSYMPPLPNESDVKDAINSIVNCGCEPIVTAIKLCLFCMKTQIFNDGNKRAAVIFANHYLIGAGGGLLVIPQEQVGEFKKLLVDYYEGNGEEIIVDFMKSKCWRKL